MTRGYEDNQRRLGTLSGFGKELARRAKSRCELCGVSGESLAVFEVPPARKEPDIEDCILVCSTCCDQLEHPKRMDAKRWRCLSNTIWSEVPAVQIVALRILKRIAPTEAWAAELLDEVYLDPEIEARASEDG